jgi:hypothetical protein
LSLELACGEPSWELVCASQPTATIYVLSS